MKAQSYGNFISETIPTPKNRNGNGTLQKLVPASADGALEVGAACARISNAVLKSSTSPFRISSDPAF